MRLLLIEDDPATAGFVRQGLSEQGWTVDLAATAADGEEAVQSGRHDLVILDVMLPDGTGIELCRSLRRQGIDLPILMLTALSTTPDKVTGLEAGADDYLVKPFEFEELIARVKALLRRGRASEARSLEFEDVTMDLIRREVSRAGRKVRLTPKEFALLEFFLRNPERVLSRTEITQHVWGMEFEYGGNVLEVYVSALRRKIERGFDKPLLHTIIGTGYMLSAEKP